MSVISLTTSFAFVKRPFDALDGGVKGFQVNCDINMVIFHDLCFLPATLMTARFIMKLNISGMLLLSYHKHGHISIKPVFCYYY